MTISQHHKSSSARAASSFSPLRCLEEFPKLGPGSKPSLWQPPSQSAAVPSSCTWLEAARSRARGPPVARLTRPAWSTSPVSALVHSLADPWSSAQARSQPAHEPGSPLTAP